jgi:hypothetical protein
MPIGHERDDAHRRIVVTIFGVVTLADRRHVSTAASLRVCYGQSKNGSSPGAAQRPARREIS